MEDGKEINIPEFQATARELQAKYAQSRREHRELLGLPQNSKRDI